MKAKVLLVDDHPVVREGLSLRINRQNDMVVCGEAENGAEALEKAAALCPDIVVLDLILRDDNGLDVLKDIKIRHPRLPVLVLSIQDERIYAGRVLQAGARGYIMKQEVTSKVIVAIRQILQGHVYLSDSAGLRLLDSMARGNPQPQRSPVEHLSNRELEVYRLLGEGLTTRAVAQKLHVSIKTVETYCERIKSHLHLATRNELLREAVLWVHTQQRPTEP
jgi:DNA-binding NarL/FixJ family response regulator